GRGTRLCPDVFGPDKPKEEFLIFDVCQNFEFFDVNKKGYDTNAGKSVTQQIFETRLEVSQLLSATGEEENLELSKRITDILHSSVSSLSRERFLVNMNLRYVDEFKERGRWNNLSSDDINNIEEYLSKLPLPDSTDEVARRFDLMMLKLQQANLLALSTETGFHEKLMNIGDGLIKKYTIPQVLKHQRTIENLKIPEFYDELNHTKIDKIRTEIRELVKYLEKVSQEIVYINILDSDVDVEAREGDTYFGKSHELYRKRVESFIRNNKHQLTISKLSSNEPITKHELKILEDILFSEEQLGTKEDFEKEYGEQTLGEFVRSILGLNLEAANIAFSEFMSTGNLRADQITFINSIITYLTKNGTIDKTMLFEPPFTNVNDQGLLGVFDDNDVVKIISIIDNVNGNASVG
ncbi:MAG: restriction endonuclease, partial [Flavobacteriales bacterium]|nr:restriction endonuclease [Flavobacteriales bacterium]